VGALNVALVGRCAKPGECILVLHTSICPSWSLVMQWKSQQRDNGRVNEAGIEVSWIGKLPPMY
jgi:hypothetical protein